MTLAILTTFALAVAASLWLWRRQAKKERIVAAPRPRGTHACVSIRPGLEACTAVWMLVGERYLQDEAPSLPVPGCDKVGCDCALNEHDDRREPGERRGAEELAPATGPVNRRSGGRRTEDRQA